MIVPKVDFNDNFKQVVSRMYLKENLSFYKIYERLFIDTEGEVLYSYNGKICNLKREKITERTFWRYISKYLPELSKIKKENRCVNQR